MRLKMRIRFVCYTIQKSTVLKIGKNTQWNPHPNVLQCRILSECSGSATLTDTDTYEIYFTPPPTPGPVVLNSCEGSIYIRVLSLIIFSTVGECIFHVGGGELCKNAFPRISKVLASTRKIGTRLTIQSFSFLSAFFSRVLSQHLGIFIWNRFICTYLNGQCLEIYGLLLVKKSTRAPYEQAKMGQRNFSFSLRYSQKNMCLRALTQCPHSR